MKMSSLQIRELDDLYGSVNFLILQNQTSAHYKNRNKISMRKRFINLNKQIHEERNN